MNSRSDNTRSNLQTHEHTDLLFIPGSTTFSTRIDNPKDLSNMLLSLTIHGGSVMILTGALCHFHYVSGGNSTE